MPNKCRTPRLLMDLFQRDWSGPGDLRGAGVRPPADPGRRSGGRRLHQRRHPGPLPGRWRACAGVLGAGRDLGKAVMAMSMSEQEWEDSSRPLGLLHLALNSSPPSKRKLILLACEIYRVVETDIPAASAEEFRRCEASAEKGDHHYLTPLLKSYFTGAVAVRAAEGATLEGLIDAVSQASRNAYLFVDYRMLEKERLTIARAQSAVVMH